MLSLSQAASDAQSCMYILVIGKLLTQLTAGELLSEYNLMVGMNVAPNHTPS